MHRPEIPLNVLAQRAETTQSGASRFAAGGGLALLRGRYEALIRARQIGLRPGMRALIDVSCPNLGGSVYRTMHGETNAFDKAETLRVIVAMTHQGLLLVTAYAI